MHHVKHPQLWTVSEIRGHGKALVVDTDHPSGASLTNLIVLVFSTTTNQELGASWSAEACTGRAVN